MGAFDYPEYMFNVFDPEALAGLRCGIPSSVKTTMIKAIPFGDCEKRRGGFSSPNWIVNKRAFIYLDVILSC